LFDYFNDNNVEERMDEFLISIKSVHIPNLDAFWMQLTLTSPNGGYASIYSHDVICLFTLVVWFLGFTFCGLVLSQVVGGSLKNFKWV